MKKKTKPASRTVNLDNPRRRTHNGLRVGDRVRCEYHGYKFPIDGNVVALVPSSNHALAQVLVEHDVDTTTVYPKLQPNGVDHEDWHSKYQVWGAEFVIRVDDEGNDILRPAQRAMRKGGGR